MNDWLSNQMSFYHTDSIRYEESLDCSSRYPQSWAKPQHSKFGVLWLVTAFRFIWRYSIRKDKAKWTTGYQIKSLSITLSRYATKVKFKGARNRIEQLNEKTKRARVDNKCHSCHSSIVENRQEFSPPEFILNRSDRRYHRRNVYGIF